MKKKRRALLVNDMLNDFLMPGGVLYCGNRARRMIPFVARKIKEFRNRGDKVFFVSDAHLPGDYELRIYLPHAMKGTRGAKLVDGIRRRSGDILIHKRFYDGFSNPQLARKLREYKIDEVYVTGVCTSICVMESVSALYHMKIPVYIYKRGVSDFDLASHYFALKRMKRIFGAHILP